MSETDLHLIPALEAELHRRSPECRCGPEESAEEPGTWIHKRRKPGGMFTESAQAEGRAAAEAFAALHRES